MLAGLFSQIAQVPVAVATTLPLSVRISLLHAKM